MIPKLRYGSKYDTAVTAVLTTDRLHDCRNLVFETTNSTITHIILSKLQLMCHRHPPTGYYRGTTRLQGCSIGMNNLTRAFDDPALQYPSLYWVDLQRGTRRVTARVVVRDSSPMSGWGGGIRLAACGDETASRQSHAGGFGSKGFRG